MAIVTLYGRSATVTSATSYPLTFFSDEFVPVALSLLPVGPMWPRDTDTETYSLVRALSHTFARIARRRSELLTEADPRAATEMLDRWEEALDLSPGALTNAERRDQIVGLLRGHTSPSIPNLIDLAATLGYTITITTYSGDLFTCVSPCTDAVYTETWIFVWDVTTPSAGLDDELDALLEAVTPLHTIRRMYFT